MPIDDIEDNEVGASVRSKLNDVIGRVNEYRILGGAADPSADPGVDRAQYNQDNGAIWLWVTPGPWNLKG